MSQFTISEIFTILQTQNYEGENKHPVQELLKLAAGQRGKIFDHRFMQEF